MYFCAAACRSALDLPLNFWLISTFPMTVFQGKRAYRWKTTPRSPIGGRPFMKVISPPVGASSPARMFRSTVLPHWPGPSRTRNSFSLTVMLMSLSTSLVSLFR